MPSSSRPASRAALIQCSAVRRRGLLTGERHLAQRPHDEGAKAGATGGEAAMFELAVGLDDRVRVDGEAGDDVLDARQAVAELEVAEAQGVLDLLHQLQVGRHPRRGIESKRYRRHVASLSLLIYHDK